jgi:hypothetical protein
MKVIFLDIDGVLVTMRSNYEDIQNKDFRDEEHSYFDPASVNLLNRLTDESGAKIVISSSWGRVFNIDEIRRVFRNGGITGEVIDLTTTIYPEPGNREDQRGLEIQQWLENHPQTTSYVIIDDLVDSIDEHHPGRFVETNSRDGFSELDMYLKAREILLLLGNE